MRAGDRDSMFAPRPRVLVVVTLAETGGAQTYVANLVPALAERYDVTVAAYGEGPLVTAVARSGAAFVPLRYLRRPLHPLTDARAILELRALCRSVRPEVVHLNSSKAIVLGTLAAWLSRVPKRVVTIHGWPFKTETGLRRMVYSAATRLVRPLVTRAICVAESERRAGVAARAVTQQQAVVIPNGVDRIEGEPAIDRRVVVSVTRLRAPKDTGTLVSAAARLGDELETLLVVGDGPERPALEQSIAAHRLAGRVELLGDREDVGDLLRQGSVFVLATRSEAMPMALLEAMAAGLPTVASNVGGIPEVVVDGETGFLVPPGDANALAAALRRLLDDADLRRSLGAAARARARDVFSLERFRTRHLDLYADLLANAPVPR